MCDVQQTCFDFIQIVKGKIVPSPAPCCGALAHFSGHCMAALLAWVFLVLSHRIVLIRLIQSAFSVDKGPGHCITNYDIYLISQAQYTSQLVKKISAGSPTKGD